MKKIFKSKGFLVSVLAAACIAILAACLYVSRDKDVPFQPEETPVSTESQDWQENSESSGNREDESHGTDAYAPPASQESTEALADYPKVSEESEDEVEISFTPTEKPEETPPAAPEGKTIIEDPGEDHPINSNPEITVPEPETSANTGPAAGDTNGDGAVYDPVFGWVVPGQVNQTTMDSDGDPNKMGGNMGN